MASIHLFFLMNINTFLPFLQFFIYFFHFTPPSFSIFSPSSLLFQSIIPPFLFPPSPPLPSLPSCPSIKQPSVSWHHNECLASECLSATQRMHTNFAPLIILLSPRLGLSLSFLWLENCCESIFLPLLFCLPLTPLPFFQTLATNENL